MLLRTARALDFEKTLYLIVIRVLYPRTRIRGPNHENVTHCRSLNLASLHIHYVEIVFWMKMHQVNELHYELHLYSLDIETIEKLGKTKRC